MNEIRFEWNPQKNTINKSKHGISFEEASTVFYDEEALVRDDPDHSEDEDRFLIIGYSILANMLIVSHCYRDDEEVIRIISARKATKREEQQYYNNL